MYVFKNVFISNLKLPSLQPSQIYSIFSNFKFQKTVLFCQFSRWLFLFAFYFLQYLMWLFASCSFSIQCGCLSSVILVYHMAVCLLFIQYRYPRYLFACILQYPVLLFVSSSFIILRGCLPSFLLVSYVAVSPLFFQFPTKGCFPKACIKTPLRQCLATSIVVNCGGIHERQLFVFLLQLVSASRHVYEFPHHYRELSNLHSLKAMCII